MFGKNKYSVTILNQNYEVLESRIWVAHIPRIDEHIYIEKHGYMRVLTVIHYLKKNQGIFIMVEIKEKKVDEKLDNA